MFLFPSTIWAADTNTVSTVVTDKAPPTASAPSIVINNSDICKSAASAAIQTQILGFASGITVTDENCERLKLSRSMYGMGMKVAAVSLLCQDARVFDAMWQAGTPCPYDGAIGDDARKGWEENPDEAPSNSLVFAKKKEMTNFHLKSQIIFYLINKCGKVAIELSRRDAKVILK